MLFFYTPILVDLPPRHIRKIAQRFGSLKTSPVSKVTLSTYLHFDALIFSCSEKWVIAGSNTADRR